MIKKANVGIMGVLFVLAAVTVPVAVHGHGHERGEQELEYRTQVRERNVEPRESSQERVRQIRQKVETRRTQVKQDVCERRQERLQAALSRLAVRSVKLQAVIDTMYERVQGFYESGQLTVENYDELDGNVAVAQADATEAVETVGNFEFELDCDNPNIGRQMDGFRTAVSEAREALKAYRTSLVELISALRAEAAGQNTQNDTANDEDDEEETDE